ncbi:MAG: glycoside hydrolase family 9 protein [Fibrobacter sp.]|nr:glycoside hydrolase family 9 protein [Fibrobacter sp.]
MPFFIVLFFALTTLVVAAEQEQPTPYDLIRPIWPMKWDTAATDDGGTVESFSKYVPNKEKHNVVPPVGSVPQDFVANGFIPDTLNQAFRDAQNLRIGRIRVNQAGYLPDDPEMQFYYVSSGNCSETFSIVDLDGKEVATGGTFTPSGHKTSSHWEIKAGTDAATANQGRYETTANSPSGTICIGNIIQLAGSLSLETRYRIKVLKQLSSTFIISPRVYSMVRDALLKFYGVNRSGNSESWFHKPSHTKDGGGPVVNDIGGAVAGAVSFKEGDLQGGWYDCGDHLKESYTQAYAFMVLAVVAGGNPDRDDDHYAYNHGETINTDGIPDILREAKHGADFFLRAYRAANGVIDNMAVSIGNFGADHSWWGRPENQDALPATLARRGGPHERDVRLGELNANVSSEIAAGLAILGREYATYDKAFADSCKMVATQMYEFAKDIALGRKTYGNNKEKGTWGTPAYSGSNSYLDDISVAAVALHFGTYPDSGMKYLNDAVEDKTIGVEQEPGVGFFRGGWFAGSRDGMRKSSNTDWANVQTYALYAFYKLLLKDEETAASFGISKDDRLWYAENVAFMLANNVSARSGEGSTSITIPHPSDGTKAVSASDLWYQMQTQMAWIYNRYQAGNIFDVFAYADVTKDLEGIRLPQKGVQNWNSAKMKQLGINQLNYLFGVNPWDISFLIGVGDKSDNHPHHRGANPEGKNMPGAGYRYTPPTGAIFGGVPPEGNNEWIPSTLSWEDYFKSETCIDGTAMFLAAATTAIKEEDRNRAPSKINVEIRYVGFDSAIVKISQDVRGPAMILYSTNETGPFSTAVKDSVPSVSHDIHMTGLQNGTTYYFKVIAINARSEAYTTKWLVDSTSTPFSFTTLASQPGPADIQNVKVCNLSADSAEIMWYTPNGQYESKMYWDTVQTTYDKMRWNTGEGNADVSGIPTNFHYVKIGGLQEKTTYYYCVESNGVRRCNNDKNQPLKFTTPVRRYNFDVSVYQYEFTGLDFMNLNLINNEDQPFSDLTLRFYVTARPEEIEATPGVNNQPGTCPLLVDEDICQAYDEAGFNRPCVNKNGESVDDSLRYYLRHAIPVKLEDTYDAATGTYQWYIPVPLGGTTIKSSSRMRIDLGFSSGIYQNGICETLRTPGKKRLSSTSGDWSWSPHTRDEDGADYDGIPLWPKDQGDIEQAPVNPYIVVYRKDEFISGFSPSYQEMVTKKADYKMTVAYNPPFNVSNGSYIQIDSSKSTMHVLGTALITESGYVTDIWVNGVALTPEQLKMAAVYNYETGKYDLDIPVKMTIGTNKVDITVFAGPNPECQECQENGGCAFNNRTYYVQFSKGDRTAGKLQLLREDGSSVSSPVIDNPMKFKIFVSDKDNAKNSSVTVTLHNSRTNETSTVTLDRTNEALGYFESGWLSAVKTEEASLPEVALLGGDTVLVTYIDAEDNEDSTSQYFYAKPTTPIPQVAKLVDTDCNSAADVIALTFTGSKFDNSKIKLDSVAIILNEDNSKIYMAMPSGAVTGDEVQLTLGSDFPAIAAPSGKVQIYMTETGSVKLAEIQITDGIAPTLVAVTILENENHMYPQDTLKVVFSEPVNLPSKTVWPFRITDGAAEIPQETIVVRSATSTDNGKSWQYVIEGNNEGKFVKQSYKAEIASGFNVTDIVGNALSTCNGPVTIIESVRPVPARYAAIIDSTGDGQPDEIYIEFTKVLREKDMFDTIDVYWGNPDIYKAFGKPQSGWALDTLLGDVVDKISYVVDSSNGTWSTKERTSCETINVPDTTFTTVEEVDSITGEITTRKVVQSVGQKTVEDPTSCKTTIDSTFIPATTEVVEKVQNQYSIIRIAIPEGTFKNATYGSRAGNGLILPRQGPLGGFFDDNTAPLSDKCPPIILKASWRGIDLGDAGQTDLLTLTMSEPLDSVTANTRLIERMRDDKAGVFIEKVHLDRIEHSSANLTSYTYYYNDDDKQTTTVHIGDYVRLIPDSTSFYKDAVGQFAGVETPWVPVVGVISNVKINVSMPEHLVTGNNELAYNGAALTKDQAFRLSVKDKSNAELIIAEGNGELHAVQALPVNNYIHGGPVFQIDLTLPQVLENTLSGEAKRNYKVKLEFDIFSNLGSFVNKVTYNLDLQALKSYVSANSTLTLYLEWCSVEGAPMSEKGKKIGTGAYIVRYDITAKGDYVAQQPDDGDKTSAKKKSTDGTMTFGFRRPKKK